VSERPLHDEPPELDLAWQSTENAWAQAVPDMHVTIAADDARQSYAVLRGMTSASGAMVAAATMSLPERADRGSDYITATPGSGTSARPVGLSPPAAPSLCSTVRFGSSPGGF